MRVISFIIGFILLTLTTLATSSFASIGEVKLHTGFATVDRQDGDKNIKVKKELDIFSYDTLKTGQGKVGIVFIDDTRVDVTEHSKLLIDEFVYDPNTKTGALSLKAKLGTVRYASGQIAKNSKQNVKISTPTATIAVRGTDFAMTIDEIGGSTIVLLPSCNSEGFCYVGEIEVQTDAGFVIMNQAFQATSVSAAEMKPIKPVLLDLELDMINNLLIITPPKKLEEAIQEEKFRAVANALDLDFLKFDELEIDMLETPEDEYASALDIDFLEQNFLKDILEELNKQLALQMRNEFDKQDEKRSIEGIFLGKNPETGVIILDEDPQWVWIREDASGGYIELRLDKEYGYIINIIQGEFEMYDFELGGQDNDINIEQLQ